MKKLLQNCFMRIRATPIQLDYWKAFPERITVGEDNIAGFCDSRVIVKFEVGIDIADIKTDCHVMALTEFRRTRYWRCQSEQDKDA